MPEKKDKFSNGAFSDELAKYKAVFDNSPAAIVLLDKKGTVLDLNGRLYEWLGYRKEEVLGKNLLALPYMTKASKTKAMKQLAKRFLGQRLEPYNLEFITKKGEIRTARIYGVIIRDAKNKMVADLVSIIDITNERAMESKAEQYLDIAGVLILSLDSKGNVVMINKRGAEILGYPKSEIEGKNWFENFLPESNQEKLRQGFQDLMGTTDREIDEVFKEGGLNEVLAKGGIEKILLWNNATIRDSEGKVIGTLSSGQDITEREEFRQKLQENQERFNLAMKGTKDGIWDWDLRTNEVYFSPPWKEMLGFRDDEIPNDFSEWEKRLHPGDKDRVTKSVQDYVKSAGDKPFEIEFRMQHKDGHYVDILARGFMQQDKAGENIRLVGTHVDMSERKKSEQEIKKIKESYDILTDNANEAIFLVDLSGGQIKYANKAAERIFGYTSEDYRNNPRLGLEVIVPGFAEKQAEVIARIVSEKKPQRNVVLGWQAKDGRRVIMEHTIIPILDDKGTVKEIQSIGRDVTRQREMQRRIQERENQLREAQRIARIGSWSWDIKKDQISWSDEMYRIFGVNRSDFDVTYPGFLQLVHPEDQKKVDDSVRKSLREGGNYSVDHRIKLPGNKIRFLHERGIVFYGSGMDPVRMVGTTQDITERKEYENKLQAKVRELEHMNELMVGRELKMVELKKKLKDKGEDSNAK